LHTGDLGEIDAEGFVRVTGRTQEILVTAGGKRVAPSSLEEHLTAHPLVDHAMVVGDGRPYLAALITLDPLAARQWATTRGSGTSPRSLAADPDLLADIRSAVDSANEQVSPAEAIRHFRVLPTAWSEDSGHLTPTAKIRRGAVYATSGTTSRRSTTEVAKRHLEGLACRGRERRTGQEDQAEATDSRSPLILSGPTLMIEAGMHAPPPFLRHACLQRATMEGLRCIRSWLTHPVGAGPPLTEGPWQSSSRSLRRC
jgi:hypothetical protein